ncbi:MAG: GNAT family N-acetyltransferase [Acidobacteriota bacterium]|jgi:ribosomal protein S18 acetylase RimI-like enzyme|nr:GNAT family N-acetyltransferase [Acidobacteriota bacterium]OQB58043.1 MAG: putative acetyltransferase [Candidatus Aminicenantes bacterium ADurb.Bin147]HNT32337.1 GNAT family N-acetyltransferase [Candidatus Aminicenantes bacterium]MDD8010339.1 GNAT family N-acetyltransferase [Acidobacteriota bacterium]MDD8028574.1 GNAT family N-acetyltransferase [Acidobacteriota bacterium]
MIRPMTPADRPAVLALIEATGFFRPDEIAVAEELIDITLGRPEQEDYAIVVVTDETGAVAGYMTYGPTPLTRGTYDLYWMAVDPKAQGRGYGRILVEWLEDHVRRAGGRLIVIETSSSEKYEPTRRFYLGLNYTETARIPDFYGPGDGRVIYTKRVS